MTEVKGDFAFRGGVKGRPVEMTYGGALSFMRRRYSRDLDGVDVVVSGVPYDASVTNRPGCRFGPQAIRAASTQLSELDSFPWGFSHVSSISASSITAIALWTRITQRRYRGRSKLTPIRSSRAGAKMLTLGGDHFVAYPLLKAHAKIHGPVALLQFDAHCDTWEDDGRKLDHGTMFARAAAEGIVDVSKSTQVGLRTYNDSDHGFEILTAPWVHRNGIDAALEIIRTRVGDAPLYVSFDVDGMDPAYAPGTGTPVVGGLASWQALELIRGLKGLNLIGMDVVEVSPPYDHSEITALAAATVAHDWLCLLAEAKGAKRAEVGRV